VCTSVLFGFMLILYVLSDIAKQMRPLIARGWERAAIHPILVIRLLKCRTQQLAFAWLRLRHHPAITLTPRRVIRNVLVTRWVIIPDWVVDFVMRIAMHDHAGRAASTRRVTATRAGTIGAVVVLIRARGLDSRTEASSTTSRVVSFETGHCLSDAINSRSVQTNTAKPEWPKPHARRICSYYNCLGICYTDNVFN